MATIIKTAILTVKEFKTPSDLVKKLLEFTNDGYEVTKEDVDWNGNYILVMEKRIPI